MTAAHYIQLPAVMLRARAALAEPEPEGPTDEELYDYWISTSPEFGCADPIGFARAVLARWGTPNLAETRSSLGDAPQPVPVSERPPGPEGLNDNGECWEWDWSSDAWVLIKPIGWTFRTGPWLPAHALPLPTAND